MHIACEGRVGKTVAEEIAIALSRCLDGERAGATMIVGESDAVIIAGLADELALTGALIESGLSDIHNVPDYLDGFELIEYEGRVVLLGNTPRGLLQAVYELQAIAREGGVVPAGLRKRGTFRIGMRIFHPRFDYWPGSRNDIRFISHLGASHCLHTHDWQGDRRRFAGYVESTVFPDGVSPEYRETGNTALRRLIDDSLDYALELAMWITELPCQGGPWVPEPRRAAFLEHYPAEVLSDTGTYQGKVLCFGHPEVRRYYRELIERFFGDFPEISILFVMGLDANGEFCDPESCPRCHGMSKFEQRDRFLRFLIEEGSRVRAGLRVLTTGWGWQRMNPSEFFERQSRLPPASGLFLAAQVDGWQPERQLHADLIRGKEVCRAAGQLFIGYDDLHWGDDSVHFLTDIQDYPLGIGAKIDRWSRLGADGLFDHWGTRCNDLPTNSIACREFFLDPAAEPARVAREIARRQFGVEAGAPLFTAWSSLDRAHAILSNRCVWPPEQWPNWYHGFHSPEPREFASRRLAVDPAWETAAGPYSYNDPKESLAGVGRAWRLAVPHYLAALEGYDEAIDRSDDSPLFYDYWWSGTPPAPGRRDHIRRQRLFAESMAIAGREIGIHFELDALSIAVDDDAERFFAAASPLLREDRAACLNAAEFFARCIERGDYPAERESIVTRYREKAAAVERLVAGQ